MKPSVTHPLSRLGRLESPGPCPSVAEGISLGSGGVCVGTSDAGILPPGRAPTDGPATTGLGRVVGVFSVVTVRGSPGVLGGGRHLGAEPLGVLVLSADDGLPRPTRQTPLPVSGPGVCGGTRPMPACPQPHRDGSLGGGGNRLEPPVSLEDACGP